MKKSHNNKGLAIVPIVVIVGILVLLVIFFIKTGALTFSGGISKTGTKPKAFQSEGITLEYPSDWSEAETTPEGFVIAFMSPKENDDDRFTENFNIRKVDLSSTPEITLKEVADLWFAQSKEEFSGSDFSLIERSPFEVAGLPAEKFVISINYQGMDSRLMVAIVLKEGTAYVTTYTAETGSYDKFLPGIDSLLSSMELE